MFQIDPRFSVARRSRIAVMTINSPNSMRQPDPLIQICQRRLRLTVWAFGLHLGMKSLRGHLIISSVTCQSPEDLRSQTRALWSTNCNHLQHVKYNYTTWIPQPMPIYLATFATYTPCPGRCRSFSSNFLLAFNIISSRRLCSSACLSFLLLLQVCACGAP